MRSALGLCLFVLGFPAAMAQESSDEAHPSDVLGEAHPFEVLYFWQKGGMAETSQFFIDGNFPDQFHCLRLQAEQGDVEAQAHLGFMLYEGKVVDQDYEQSVEWLRKAAEAGHSDAQAALGLCYAKGRGVKQSEKEAFVWFRTAAEGGNGDAQANLGLCYAKGLGTPQDLVQAHLWLGLAAEAGAENAAETQEIVAKHMSAEQIGEAQRLAREWKPKG